MSTTKSNPAVRFAIAILIAAIMVPSTVIAGDAFVHPGMLQTYDELEFMTQKVAAGEDPWKTAWSNLCSESYSSMDFQPKPVAHVVRGSYGRPSIGDRALMDSANAAYSQALQWVVTRDKTHAQKAIDIINAWSYTLWDFQDNDAKLLAAWTGHTFCNAAEILRSTDAGWKDQDQEQFKRMLLTVYVPLLKDYFPEANGNWDAAIMDTMLCIGIFCDDHSIFETAVNHFQRGPGNGGVTKYVYPTGQCEESVRDEAHTQLGLGEMAQACQVAWNQGVDLYGTANDRLALGFEYTAKYNLGESVPAHGVLSTQARGRFSDIYEEIYQHYHFVKGLEMPFTERALERTRAEKTWSALTLYQGAPAATPVGQGSPQASAIASDVGAATEPAVTPPVGAVTVTSGESIQNVLDTETNGGWIVLSKGLYVLPSPLRIPSDVTLAGQGNSTVLMLDPDYPADRAGVTIVSATDDLHDVTLRDFMIEGDPAVRTVTNSSVSYNYVSGSGSGAVTLRPMANDPNQARRLRSYQMAPSRAGIIFSAQRGGQMRDLHLEHITVRDCTHDGVAIYGADNVVISACDLSGNGSSVVPGPGLQHDLLLTRVGGAQVSDSRLDDSLWGNGLELSASHSVKILNNEMARNALNGLHVTESRDIHVRGNLTEGNDGNGILFDAQMDGCSNIEVANNLSRNNGDNGIRLIKVVSSNVHDNSGDENGVSGNQ
ncbi:MAG TPA: alginate lyase family protein [Verrucomicrobiae bacterium]